VKNGTGAVREIVFDTETTGTDPAAGDRVVEIGAVELLNHIPTGRTYHVYLNPGRAMSQGALAVHGLTDAFLADKPVFAAIADEMLEFFGDARLIAHNAGFDMNFLNAELKRIGAPPLDPSRILDTLALARRKHPGAANNLDALCARYGIDNSRRTKHGALLDAEILAEVYIELIGGKQPDLGLMHVRAATPALQAGVAAAAPAPRAAVLRLTDAEREAHRAFVATLGPNPLWRAYLGEPG
jgi:DNA polymerase-3 subunit epsilon